MGGQITNLQEANQVPISKRRQQWQRKGRFYKRFNEQYSISARAI